jgi:hypothetical protein
MIFAVHWVDILSAWIPFYVAAAKALGSSGKFKLNVSAKTLLALQKVERIGFRCLADRPRL